MMGLFDRFIFHAVVLGVVGASNVYGQQVISSHPHNGAGTTYLSATLWEDGSDWDQWCWDRFFSAQAGTIAEIVWRGGYAMNRAPGALYGFEIEIYGSISGDSQPFLTQLLFSHEFVGSADETYAGRFGSIDLYDYRVALPTAFDLHAGTTYWVMIKALQPLVFPPDWGIAEGMGDDGLHFLLIEGCPCYRTVGGDLAITILGTQVCSVDFNGDGLLNFFDVSAFLIAFAAGDQVADLNGDGMFNFFDVSAFLNVFGVGCP